MAKKKYGPYKGYYPQKYLFEYLSIEIDPYDFPHYMLEEWGKEREVKIGDDDYADILTPAQLEDYEKWLVDRDKAAELLRDNPRDAPAYLTLMWPEKMPKKAWAIHFTDEPGIEEFRYGAEIPKLALSTWWEKKDEARCPENLTDELGTYEYVYVFAFPAEGKGSVSISKGMKYGRHAVLFQTDAAVRAYHSGDEEYQLIIPACSEYNVIPLGIQDGEITCAFEGSDGNDGLSFGSVKELLEYVKKEESEGRRVLERLRC